MQTEPTASPNGEPEQPRLRCRRHDRAPETARVLPKIPQYGPAAQLSPDVLLANIAEPGCVRPRFQSWSPRDRVLPRKEDRPTRKFPALLSPRSVGYVSEAVSKTGIGLWSLLYKGDHTHCFRNPSGTEEDDMQAKETVPPEGVVERGDSVWGQRRGDPVFSPSTVNENLSPEPLAWFPPSRDDVAQRAVHQAPCAASAAATPDRGSAISHPHLGVPRRTAVHAHGASWERDKAASSESAARQASLRASFRLEASQIQAELEKLHGFHCISEVPTDLSDPRELSFRSLFMKSGLADCPPRKPVIRCDAFEESQRQKILDDCQEVMPRVSNEGLKSSRGDTASSTEISCCTAVLNFHRWLCGLPQVRLNSARLMVCDMLSLALLPRAASALNLEKEAGSFAESLVSILGAEGCNVCVLHCEASLIAAIDQSLNATHMVTPPANHNSGKERELHCRALATRVEAKVERRGSKQGSMREAHGGAGTWKIPILPPQATLTIEDLPDALTPLRVLWELRPGNQHASPAQEPAAITGALNKNPEENVQPSTVRPRRVKPRRIQGLVDTDRIVGLSPIWGDRRGSLSFRRCLLNPELREFGVARREDTCILWTGPDEGLGIKPRLVSSRRRSQTFGTTPSCDYTEGLSAVCYPPAGVVPLFLLQKGCTPWSIMPDSKRYQPTSTTNVRVWYVRIDRLVGKEWTAIRSAEVQVKGFTVDCSSSGEPFCVVFWPDFMAQDMEGAQLEVTLSGLRGPSAELTFFYEFHSFLQPKLDKCLCMEAARVRSFLSPSALWGDGETQVFKDQKGGDSTAQPGSRAMGVQRNTKSEAPEILAVELVSHKELSFITNSCDVTIVLKSQQAAVMRGELHLVRFSGEEVEIKGATQIQRLADSHFLVRAKMPMQRCRFELRFFLSSRCSPYDLKLHPLKYLITTGRQCQTLLTTIDDSRRHKFGYATFSPAVQTHGVVVLAPLTRRIVSGSCYFLVHIDKEAAIAAARDAAASAGGTEASASDAVEGIDLEVSRAVVSRAEADGDPRPTSSLYTRRLIGDPSNDPGGSGVNKGSVLMASGTSLTAPRAQPPAEKPSQTTALQSQRGPPSAGSSAADYPSAMASCSALCPMPLEFRIVDLHRCLSQALSRRTQDSAGEVHLDVVMRNGECIHRLAERMDLPGLYEGFAVFSDADAMTTVKLYVRFPRAHAIEYAPRLLVEWVVCRNEVFPINF